MIFIEKGMVVDKKLRTCGWRKSTGMVLLFWNLVFRAMPTLLVHFQLGLSPCYMVHMSDTQNHLWWFHVIIMDILKFFQA